MYTQKSFISIPRV